MNISTGGPHILLFERDQQLAGLLVSEFQLAGYECHTARTAVEVFDAIARQPVRLVLVNLAQAAAARREFWVALDTQRRGRGVQVLTFRCNNIAGYSSHDFEDHAQMAAADVEVDGMLGVMNLVDAVRARVPHLPTTTNTLPRMPRAATPLPPMTGQQRPVQTPQPTTNTGGIFTASGTATRSSVSDEAPQVPQAPVRGPSPVSPTGVYTAQSQPMPPPPAQTAPAYQASAIDTAGTTANQASYTDKIRAVLYPNQRSWTPQGGNASPISPDIRSLYDPQSAPAPQSVQETSAGVSMLQHLASGQAGPEPGESGLAQLSRMVQQRQASTQVPEREQPVSENRAYRYADMLQTEVPEQATAAATSSPPAPEIADEISAAAYPASYTPPATTTPSSRGGERIQTQPLRAAPIEDTPIERATGGQAGTEGNRRPDVLSRANYGQQPPVAIPPLASIASQTVVGSSAAQSVGQRGAPARLQQEEAVIEQASPLKTTSQGATRSVEERTVESERANTVRPAADTPREGAPKRAEEASNNELSTSPENAMILDIVQSLPPMPPVTAQASQVAQPQVLNGRATRTLGSVLIEGHLVPQNRLEVAQHVQRMLRGVDLNYQLGEILLMFKLLTPDQLLAASLVSYGLITTAQISALGRIRQELHSIGLEYDLENLVILFRILTPEQLREVRASWQS